MANRAPVKLVARAHRHSPRAKAPFIALNMAAIPKDLIESELFGHEKGAFTERIPFVRAASNRLTGDIIPDEIGDMPLDVQTRLLRVLADGQFLSRGRVCAGESGCTHYCRDTRTRSNAWQENSVRIYSIA